jgi:hypothetical protein
MVTTVKLKDTFEYSGWMIALAVIVTLIGIALLVFAIVFTVRALKTEKPVVLKAKKLRLTPERIFGLKNQYVSQVQSLLQQYNVGKIDKRDGYQKLSGVIRGFIQEATGINVQNYTIKEVKAMGIRRLDKLMEEYYVPEFAEDEKAEDKDFVKSCNTAMGVIRSWS